MFLSCVMNIQFPKRLSSLSIYCLTVWESSYTVVSLVFIEEITVIYK